MTSETADVTRYVTRYAMRDNTRVSLRQSQSQSQSQIPILASHLSLLASFSPQLNYRPRATSSTALRAMNTSRHGCAADALAGDNTTRPSEGVAPTDAYQRAREE